MTPQALQSLRASVSALLAEHPELREDEAFRLDMIEAETDALDMMDRLLEAEQEDAAIRDGLIARMTEMDARMDRAEARIDARRALMFKVAEIVGVTPIARPLGTVSLRKGSQKVEITADPNDLPDHLVVVSRKAKASAIKEALEAGEIIPGCRLSNGAPTIAVRFK